MRAAACRVLLTGASGGIGSAAAAQLLSAGASVMLTGRSPAGLSAQARDLMREYGVDRERVEWHAADLAGVSSPAAITAMADAAALWRCNTLIHAAGVPAFGRVESLAAQDIAAVLHLNLFVPMLLTQALLGHLHGQAQSQVIFIGSVLGRIGLPGYSVYSAGKFGLRGFSESLRRELAGSHIRVQYLGPRGTRTAFNSAAVEQYNDDTHSAMDSPAVVARALLQMLESGQAERFLGFPEKVAVRLNGLAPTLLDGAFERHRRSLLDSHSLMNNTQ